MPLLIHSRTSVTYYISFQIDDTFIRCPRTHAPSLAARLARATHARDVPERPERSSAFVSHLSLDARLSRSSLASRATLDALWKVLYE